MQRSSEKSEKVMKKYQKLKRKKLLAQAPDQLPAF